MKRLIHLILCMLLVMPAAANRKQKLRVACVGNSVTYGDRLPDREKNAYPTRLQRMLGEGYDVRNFGHNGATLLNRGHNPYTRLPEFRQALDFRPDLVVIHLGLNDTDPRNWPQHSDDFIADYRALIDSFRVANPHAKIWVCGLTPIFPNHKRFESGTRDWHKQIRQRIRQIAATAITGYIDLYTPLHKRPNLFPDALHPDTTGAQILARTVYGALTGDYGGLKLPQTYGDGMVMQRGQNFSIHGIANTGERVTVDFLSQRRTVQAGSDGRWEVPFAAQPAGGPYELKVAAKSGKCILRDIWFGEVWLCSGQSNMELTVKETLTAREDTMSADTVSRVRLYDMKGFVSLSTDSWTKRQLDSINNLQYYRPGRWERCTPKNVADFSAIAWNFGRFLADSLGCHVGLISNAIGGSCTENWIDRGMLEDSIPAMLRGDWKEGDYTMEWARRRAKANLGKNATVLQRHPYEPAYLFEDGLLPLERYPIRGVLWYQGESNAHNIELHERLFRMLVKSWRQYWNAPELPFYFVQLSGISGRPSWPAFRDSQRRLAEEIPNTWMTVSSDLGDLRDIHPRHKREIGERLLSAALCHTYGHAVEPSGPQYSGFTTEQDRLRLSFSHAKGLHAANGGQPIGFEVAGADGIYHAATATVDGETILVESSAVNAPCAVRYGWKDYTTANLVNGAGLSASTFRDERFCASRPF